MDLFWSYGCKAVHGVLAILQAKIICSWTRRYFACTFIQAQLYRLRPSLSKTVGRNKGTTECPLMVMGVISRKTCVGQEPTDLLTPDTKIYTCGTPTPSGPFTNKLDRRVGSSLSGHILPHGFPANIPSGSLTAISVPEKS